MSADKDRGIRRQKQKRAKDAKKRMTPTENASANQGAAKKAASAKQVS